jgi:hypothetical protein
MNVWKNENWKNSIEYETYCVRRGLRLYFQKGVDIEVKRSCIEFAKWIRKQYYFPIRVPVYFKLSRRIKCQDGDLVPGKIYLPFDKSFEPYITLATGDIDELRQELGEDNALGAIMGSMVHELTHYFQWVNDISLSDIQAERQANYYEKKIVRKYAMTREHP